VRGGARSGARFAGHERARLVLLSISDFIAEPASTSASVGAVAPFVHTEPTK